eukprot:COSAG01_NODE_2675_length_7264_cov_29.639358_2_plen_212_part_00
MYRYMYSARCAQHFRTRVRTRTEIRRVPESISGPISESDLPTYREPGHRAMCTAYHLSVDPLTLTHGWQCQMLALPQAPVPPLTARGCSALHVSWCRGPMTAEIGDCPVSDCLVSDCPVSDCPVSDCPVSDCLAGGPWMCRPPPFPPSPCPLCPWSCPLCLPLLSSPCSVSLCAAGGRRCGSSSGQLSSGPHPGRQPRDMGGCPSASGLRR